MNFELEFFRLAYISQKTTEFSYHRILLLVASSILTQIVRNWYTNASINMPPSPHQRELSFAPIPRDTLRRATRQIIDYNTIERREIHL